MNTPQPAKLLSLEKRGRFYVGEVEFPLGGYCFSSSSRVRFKQSAWPRALRSLFAFKKIDAPIIVACDVTALKSTSIHP